MDRRIATNLDALEASFAAETAKLPDCPGCSCSVKTAISINLDVRAGNVLETA